MLELSVSVEGWFGLTWSNWKRLVTEVERLGFSGLFLSDHLRFHEAPAYASLELLVALTYLADHTQRIHFGPMVSPLSVRDPVLLARQAAALDDLSGGRMVLGVGAGWNEPEHEMFGYVLGDVPTRFARFEEGLEVITRLLCSNDPTSYEGRFFRLHQAMLLPHTQRPGGPPIMIGGSGPRRMLPLIARYADSWNAIVLLPEAIQERSLRLDQLLIEAGRRPTEVKRTATVPIFCGHNPAEIEAQTKGLRRARYFATMSLSEIQSDRAAIMGTPEEVITQIRAYAAVGIQELMIQWFAPDDIDGLRVLAEEVMPHVTN